MSRQRPVLQTLWHKKPAESVLVQSKWRITRNCVQAFGAYLWLEVGRFSFYEAGNIDAGPLVRVPVPPHQFLAFAPGTAVRPRTGTIVYNAAIARSREAPAVTEIILGFP